MPSHWRPVRCPICDDSGWIPAIRIDGKPTSVRCDLCRARYPHHPALTYYEALEQGRIQEQKGVYDVQQERYLTPEEAKEKMAEILARLTRILGEKAMKPPGVLPPERLEALKQQAAWDEAHSWSAQPTEEARLEFLKEQAEQIRREDEEQRARDEKRRHDQ
jgi:hypothetical protein